MSVHLTRVHGSTARPRRATTAPKIARGHCQKKGALVSDDTRLPLGWNRCQTKVDVLERS